MKVQLPHPNVNLFDEYLSEGFGIERGIAIHRIMKAWNFQSDSLCNDVLDNIASEERVKKEMTLFISDLVEKEGL